MRLEDLGVVWPPPSGVWQPPRWRVEWSLRRWSPMGGLSKEEGTGHRRTVRGHTGCQQRRWTVGSQPQPFLLYSAVEPGGGRGEQPSNRHRQPSAASSPWSRFAEVLAEPHLCQPPPQPKAPAPRGRRGKALSPWERVALRRAAPVHEELPPDRDKSCSQTMP